MDEIKLNLVGNENDIKKEVIFNNFDVNFLPIKNIPITYFPLNNPQISTELKTIDSSQSLNNQDFVDNIDVNNKLITFTASSNNFKITKDITCDILLVGGGGGGGGGGEVIYLKNYVLKKGIYKTNIGTGGTGGTAIEATDGKSTYLIRDNITLFTAKGGIKGNGYITENNSTSGELIDIDGTEKYYGNGGGYILSDNSKNGNYGNGGGKKNIVVSGLNYLIRNDYVIFNSNGIITINDSITCDIFMIGGGGGGGLNHGGGGGAGAYFWGCNLTLNAGTYNINIGTGGTEGVNGGNTSITSNGINIYLVNGGGRGGGSNYDALGGGCGGGGLGWDGIGTRGRTAGGTANNSGTNGTGFDGGRGIVNSHGHALGGGGGGGIGGVGGDATDAGGGGVGGAGLNINITGTNVVYGGGGGGGAWYGLGDLAGAGGGVKSIIVGGAGKDSSSWYNTGNNAVANTGSGGGGGAQAVGYGGSGGSGVVIIRIKNISRDGTNGVFMLKYLNDNNLQFIKKNSNKVKSIETTNLNIEPSKDNPNYKLIIFRTSGTLTINKDISCDILLVGGGGGGGYYGGGGGGGGVYEVLNYNLSKGTYTITIGSGGNGGNTQNGSNGSNSFILTGSSKLFEAGGGGGGGSGNNIPTINIITGVNGIKGSGGGAGIIVGNRPVQHNINGGTGYTNGGKAYRDATDTSNLKIVNGGGGGAGGNGEYGNLDKNKGGDGGYGKLSQITKEYYGGGGGGGGYGTIEAKGGNGGGGNSGKSWHGSSGKNGDNNTGGGGGGGEHMNNGGSGGSGIVIIRVKAEDLEDGETIDQFETRFSNDTIIVNSIKNEFRTKMKIFEDINKPYNYFSIYPLVIIIIIIWIFISLFLLKFLHYYFASIYIYILIIIIIFLLVFGSLWFLYTNNDLL